MTGLVSGRVLLPGVAQAARAGWHGNRCACQATPRQLRSNQEALLVMQPRLAPQAVGDRPSAH